HVPRARERERGPHRGRRDDPDDLADSGAPVRRGGSAAQARGARVDRRFRHDALLPGGQGDRLPQEGRRTGIRARPAAQRARDAVRLAGAADLRHGASGVDLHRRELHPVLARCRRLPLGRIHPPRHAGDPATRPRTDPRASSDAREPPRPAVAAGGALPADPVAGRGDRAPDGGRAVGAVPGAARRGPAHADGERELRIAAVRLLPSRGYRNAAPRVESVVTGSKLKNADLTEKMIFFEAFGSLVGARGIATLEKMLAAKGLLGRKEDPETRACAAMALGKVRTPEARAVLERAAQDKEPLVRNAVSRALREVGG